MPYLNAIFIGREAECAIKLTDPSVSRIHAEAQLLASGDVYITDCHSRRGTFVDEGGHESRIRQGRVSRHATLRLGKSRLPVATIVDTLRRAESSRAALVDSWSQPQPPPPLPQKSPPQPKLQPQPLREPHRSNPNDVIRCVYCSEIKPVGAPCPTCRRHTEFSP